MSVPLASQLFASEHLGHAPVMTDREIADQLGVSHALVFHLRMRAMSKIREAVLTDPELRELAEEFVGRRLPEPARCEGDDCDSTSDVRDVLWLRGGEYSDPGQLCKSCRMKHSRRARLVKAGDVGINARAKQGAGP
jgi:hypothetical protein